MRRLFILMIMGYCCVSSSLHAGFFERKMEGWFWFETKDKRAKPKILHVPQKAAPAPQIPPPSARAILKQWQELLEESKAKAILYPTNENVKHYIILQNDLMQRTENFSNSWVSVHYQNPHLNYAVKHPYHPVGLKPYYEEKQKTHDKILEKVAGEYGFFFFYSSTCPHCHAFAPVLKKWGEMKGFKIIGVTLDGKTIEGFEDSKIDNGISRKFGITHVPSLVGVNPRTNHILPIAAAPLPIPEIENSIIHLVTGGSQ